MTEINRDDFTWYKCPYCGHKLFRGKYLRDFDCIEIKCSSCKKIVTLNCEKSVDGG